jgi:hypothetical protein
MVKHEDNFDLGQDDTNIFFGLEVVIDVTCG